MTYKELKNIAQPHIRKGDNLPSSSFLLLNQLHIPFRNEIQCEHDYNGKMNPLYNNPAFLVINKDEKIIYFNSKTRFWNFYLFHEIAHYLLGHEGNSPQNELDANLLACILIAPVENFPTTIKTAQDLSILCTIPIDRAEEYWQNIKGYLPYKSKNLNTFLDSAIICFLIVGTILLFLTSYNHLKTKDTVSVQPLTSLPSDYSNNKPYRNYTTQSKVAVTTSGDKYHTLDCEYVLYKNNIIQYDLNVAVEKGYSPCKRCH